MTTVDNYIAAIRDFSSKGNIKEADEAVAALKEYLQGQTAGTMQEGFDKKQRGVYESLEEDIDNPKINNPIHYQSFNPEINIDCITAMRAAFGDDEVAIFCKLNAFKYNWRAYSKGKNNDIGKAIWYLNKYLELNK